MRTALAFVFGVALVSAIWVVAGPSQTTKGLLDPAVEGPAAMEGLGETVTDFSWQGPGGESANLSDLTGSGPVVVAIRDLSCPVSQKYGMTLQDLEEGFSAKGVHFLYVDLTPAVAGRNPGIAKDQAGLNGTYVRHVGDGFFSSLHPRTTTEVFLIDGSGVLRYRGAVDDQFGVDFARQSPDQRYLTDAIEATLRGAPPPVGSTFAPGCYLTDHSEADHDAGTPEASSPPISYARDIRPLIEESCGSCHSEGGAGSFPLDGYEAVAARGDEIGSMVAQDRMPPWLANPRYGRWANDPRLSASDKSRILRWIEAGMPRGESTAEVAPQLSVRTPARKPNPWRNGEPDAVLSMGAPQTVEEGGSTWATFYIPTDFGEDRWVSGVEIRPSAPDAAVQAVVLLEDPDTPPRDRSFGLEGFFAAYAAGYPGDVFPAGTAKLLPAGAWLKLQIHYRARTVPIQDQTKIGLTFTDAPPRGVLETRSAFATGFEIPSHTPHHAVTAEHFFPMGGEIHSFTPQMHLRGSAIRYVLVEPSGRERTLLDIPRYSFQLRTKYVAADPISVEAGSTLRATGWFDNSEVNTSNPDPSVSASFGSGLTDELLIGYFDFLANAPGPVAVAEMQDRDDWVEEDDRGDRDEGDR